jgi:hypothetical protein
VFQFDDHHFDGLVAGIPIGIVFGGFAGNQYAVPVSYTCDSLGPFCSTISW